MLREGGGGGHGGVEDWHDNGKKTRSISFPQQAKTEYSSGDSALHGAHNTQNGCIAILPDTTYSK